ncbi:MAG: DeoR/GlpR family DNA-binding transcription regulator [Gaiellaceae bacterium]|jgi:DeoR/GlpR family transcriptional regulator of sugar metabolism
MSRKPEASRKRRLLASERRRRTAELVEQLGVLRISELAEMFDVSDETVRRDFSILEDQGLLTRAYGGALAAGKNVETSYSRRMREHQKDKDRIAKVAAELIHDGSTIILDSGTTMRYLASHLRTKRDLVVITNGVSNVDELLVNQTMTVVITGGMIRRTTLGSVGDLAVATLEALRADQTFIATQGFSADAGLTYPSFEEVAVKRAMIAAGAEVTLLADGSKCGRSSMVRVAPLTAVQRIITSPPIPDEERQKIADLPIELVVTGEEARANGASPHELPLGAARA